MTAFRITFYVCCLNPRGNQPLEWLDIEIFITCMMCVCKKKRDIIAQSTLNASHIIKCISHASDRAHTLLIVVNMCKMLLSVPEYICKCMCIFGSFLPLIHTLWYWIDAHSARSFHCILNFYSQMLPVQFYWTSIVI